MSKRVTYPITMTLLSDAIFGSGFSIPGGEDIAVCRDEQGFPYLKGSTLKGLLRESMTNWLAWTGGSGADLHEILGQSGWNGESSHRRLLLTDLRLQDPPKDPESYFGLRTFTSLENGIIKDGTLRTASCVHRGLSFYGAVSCAKEDEELVRNSLRGIRWVGTLRSRGFGRVKLSVGKAVAEKAGGRLPACTCIRYQLRTELPVLMTDLERSRENTYETKGYLTGSAIRGMVFSTLARREPKWFRKHRRDLLSDGVRFLDALPNPTEGAVLPSVKGFYEDKQETVFTSVLLDGELAPGLKRAKLGSFCRIEGDTIYGWSAKTGGVTRIQRNVQTADEDTQPFQTRYLCAGQTFEGYILLDDPTLAPMLSSVFSGEIWIGADRYEGFGKCSVTAPLEAIERPRWQDVYGCKAQDEIGTTLYLLAVSPLAMLDQNGHLQGLDTAELENKLGVASAKVEFCSTSISAYHSYNRTWQSRSPSLRMYDAGSVFKLQCSEPPALENILAIQEKGLGVRRGEGFGQVLFMSRERFEAIQKKGQLPSEEKQATEQQRQRRRAKYEWVEQTNNRVLKGKEVSESQLGTIQSLCEQAISCGGDRSVLETYFKKVEKQGAEKANRFKEVKELVFRTLDLEDGKDVAFFAETPVERLEALCLLFDYSRKGKKDKKGE